MPVLYDLTNIVPAPFLTVAIQDQIAEDGTRLTPVYTLTLTGKLVATPPGTTPVDTDAKLGVILTKQKALRSLFSRDGRTFEVYSPDGSQVTKCNPIIRSVDFAEGNWVEVCDYTITMESDRFYTSVPEGPPQSVNDITESWQIEEDSLSTFGSSALQPVWKLTHNVSAKGRISYDDLGVLVDPWKNARDWVVDRLASTGFAARPFDTSGELGLTATEGYNQERTETVDITGGTFSVVETWILAYGSNAAENYTVGVKYTPEDTQITATVTVSGSVRGFSVGLNQPQTKIDNAILYFNTSVVPNLFTRAQSKVSAVLSDYGTNGSVDYNYADGTISYTYEYNDKPPDASTLVYDNYVVSRRATLDTPEISVTVAGTVTGRLTIREPNTSLLKFQRAKTYFDVLVTSGAFLTRANTAGVVGLKTANVGDNIDFNMFEGTIQYSYEFNNRLFDTARNEYTIESRYTRETGQTSITLGGTIVGYRQTDSDPITAKYANALSYWGVWEPQIKPTVGAFASSISTTPITLHPDPLSTSRGDNPLNGTIQYSHEYNTDIPPITAGALSEKVTVSNNKGGQVFAIIPVLGRAAGPVIQDIGTIKEKGCSVSVDIQMEIGSAQPNTDTLVNAYKPTPAGGATVFIDRDEEQWEPKTFHYTRTISWVFE